MNNKIRVLVVDDNKINLELFTDFLAVGGYESLNASTGEDAIEIARREHPELVLLDIQLPGIDGLTVARILKNNQETKDIKVVALTAYAMQKDHEIFRDEALDGYIPKPVSLKEFLSRLDEYLREH
ncbi:MAG TPA: response regulator [Dissulfurispiraceae bacterium]|nr:response regulator [Dissulfurispiraceae bacterium]